MNFENKKIRKYRIVCGILLAIGIIIPLLACINIAETFIIVIVFIYVDAIVLAFFICSLFLSCRIYEYNGLQILVYAGWYHHYLKVDGIITDEHNTIISYVPIILSCNLNNGETVKATISCTNRIALKINNQLYTKIVNV